MLVVTESDTSNYANSAQHYRTGYPPGVVCCRRRRFVWRRRRFVGWKVRRSERVIMAQTNQTVLRGERCNRIRLDGRKAARPEIHLSRAAIPRQHPRARGNARAAARSQYRGALSERHVAAHAGNRTIPSAPTEGSIYSLTRRAGLTDRLPGKNHDGDNANGFG